MIKYGCITIILFLCIVQPMYGGQDQFDDACYLFFTEMESSKAREVEYKENAEFVTWVARNVVVLNELPLMLPTYGVITAYFGDGRNHKGIDIANKVGTPVTATGDGIVVFIGDENDGYGLQARVHHNSIFDTRYAHLSSVAVSVGDVVLRGDRIGTIGDTGRSRGAHLHYEIIRNGTPVPPSEYWSLFR